MPERPDESHADLPIRKAYVRRLREIYRSAGWPCLDALEIELLAAQLLERLQDASGHERLRVTDRGIRYMAQGLEGNRQALDKHNGLVERIARSMLREGRLVWTLLSLRAKVAATPDEAARWRYCMPDVFSIRNSSVASYLEPVVHEIKVSRADLLGDLRRPQKRQAYLQLGGQCWYVLGRDARNRPIAHPDEVPPECGVMQVVDSGIEVLRMAPKRSCSELPFGIWMALARATPLRSADDDVDTSMLL